MGRLTLNVLLSFAQFEREVTGERIRDKIAASKTKGMWMGGTVPLGYDVETESSLSIRPKPRRSACCSRSISEFGSIQELGRRVEALGIRTKLRVAIKSGRLREAAVSPTGTYGILLNPIYVGRIRHRRRPSMVSTSRSSAGRSLMAFRLCWRRGQIRP